MRSTNFRASLLFSTMIAGTLVAAPAVAQDAAEDDSVIFVTGSRIASPTVESAAPLQLVDAETIDDSGATNIQELLLENPIFGTPTFSRTNSAFLNSGTGVATVDLRDLGSDRTLVLINGRRVVASLSGSATVDLNVIPTQFIERIDILTGGASSLYGSDAIAGVVNFIYDQDFEGLVANGQAGITEKGDDERFQLNLTGGTSFGDGDGHLMVHLGYSKENGVLSRQRRNTQVDDSDSFAISDGLAADIPLFGVEAQPFFSGFAPQGRFNAGDYSFTYGPNGTLQPCFTSNGPSCTSEVLDEDGAVLVPGIGTGAGPNGFNRQNFRTIAVPVERYLFAASGNYDITDNIGVFFEGTFNRTTSSREIEPFALASDGTTGVYPADGLYNLENYVTRDFDGNGVVDPTETNRVIANPFAPTAILAQAVDGNGDGLRDISFARRITEFGSRTGSTDRDFYRFVVGLDGTLMDDRFRWDVSYNYGAVSENQISSGQVNVVNFRDALAGIPDYDNIDPNSDVVCLSAQARSNGCVATNIFGFNSISQGAVDFIQAQGTYQTDISQQVIQGNISGTLFDLPAGGVGLALGGEYRKETSSEDNDALTNQGLNAGNKLPDTSGSFDVVEGFAEIRVPILADTPFFELLEVGAAARIGDYSTVGEVFSWNVTGTWSPIQDIRIRGSYAESVRAPNVGELFSGLAQTFPSGLQDPCDGIEATGGGATGTNCRAAPGVLANITENGEFTITQPDRQGISGFDGGNENLDVENATSWTVGAVINPRSIDALRNLTLTVDYYDIEVTDVIAAYPRQFILEQCYGEGRQELCDLIIRRPTETGTNSAGSIEFINAIPFNAARLETEGLDATLSYFTPVGLTGGDRLNFGVAYTHLFQHEYTPEAGAAPDVSLGEIGTAQDRFTANVAYGTDLLRLAFTGTFIGASSEDDQFCAAFDFEPGCFEQPAEFYLDTQVQYNVAEFLQFYVGVDNLLDNDAPNLLSNTTFNTTGTDTAADVYDVFGRRYYMGARLTF